MKKNIISHLWVILPSCIKEQHFFMLKYVIITLLHQLRRVALDLYNNKPFRFSINFLPIPSSKGTKNGFNSKN